QRYKRASPHGPPPQAWGRTLPHTCARMPLCITAKLRADVADGSNSAVRAISARCPVCPKADMGRAIYECTRHVAQPTVVCLTCAAILAWISSQFLSGARLRVRGRKTFSYIALSKYL